MRTKKWKWGLCICYIQSAEKLRKSCKKLTDNKYKNFTQSCYKLKIEFDDKPKNKSRTYVCKNTIKD